MEPFAFVCLFLLFLPVKVFLVGETKAKIVLAQVLALQFTPNLVSGKKMSTLSTYSSELPGPPYATNLWQVYEGIVFMDFSADVMKQLGHGIYSRIELKSGLPKFFLAYIGDPSDSGKIHNTVFARWQSGDPEVLEAVRMFAHYTEEAKEAIEGGQWETLAKLMDQVRYRMSLLNDSRCGEIVGKVADKIIGSILASTFLHSWPNMVRPLS